MATSTEQFLDLLISAAQNPNNDGVKDRAVVILDKLLNLLIKEDGTDSPLATVGSGLPNTDISVDGYRTGKLGLGEATPEEQLDVVGTQLGATGGVKFDYTWTSGAVSRVQFAGQNVLSEIGVPADLVEANLFDFFGVGTQSDLRAYLYNGDVDAVSAAAGKISVGVGVQALSTSANANFTVFPNDNGTSPDMVARVINSHPVNGYSYITAYHIATSTPYTTEPAVENRVYDLANAKIGNYYWTAHWADYNEGLKMDMLGAGTLIPGYIFGNTAATVIGAIAKGIGVDANGQFLAIDGSYAGSAAPASASATGEAGEIRYDGTYLYFCTATDTWERAALSSATW